MRVSALLGLLLLGLAAPRAAALEQTARVEGLRPLSGAGQLLCDIDLTGLFPPPVESTLRSGLPVVIDLAIEIELADGETLGRLLRSEVSYDVWEDRYLLRRGGESQDFADLEGLRAACSRYRAQPLASWSLLPAGRALSLSLRVAVNPLGGEDRRRMARWLARTVGDPADPSSRELRLDLGALIGDFFGKGDDGAGWGAERHFGPFLPAQLPAAASEETP